MDAIAESAIATTRLMSADEFGRLHENDRVELVNGVVEELSVSWNKHGSICNLLAFFLTEHVRKNDLGRVMTNDSFIRTRTDPDTIRGPDVSYYSYERLPKGPVPDGLLPNIPDLVVEVRSPSDRWSKVTLKALEYLEAGVRVAIVLDSATATACIYRADEIHHFRQRRRPCSARHPARVCGPRPAVVFGLDGSHYSFDTPVESRCSLAFFLCKLQ